MQALCRKQGLSNTLNAVPSLASNLMQETQRSFARRRRLRDVIYVIRLGARPLLRSEDVKN